MRLDDKPAPPWRRRAAPAPSVRWLRRRRVGRPDRLPSASITDRGKRQRQAVTRPQIPTIEVTDSGRRCHRCSHYRGWTSDTQRGHRAIHPRPERRVRDRDLRDRQAGCQADRVVIAAFTVVNPQGGALMPLHGIGGRQDLPLPFELVVAGAAAAVVASFVVLALAWKRPGPARPG